MDLLTRIRRFIRRHGLLGPDTAVAAAVSGGSDSVALAHVLRPRIVVMAGANERDPYRD